MAKKRCVIEVLKGRGNIGGGVNPRKKKYPMSIEALKGRRKKYVENRRIPSPLRGLYCLG